MILYAPPSSVMVERDFSINAGLPASTATPGRTAPLWSFTIPVSVLWARAPEHAMNTNRQAMEIRFSIPILPPFRQSHACRGGKNPLTLQWRAIIFLEWGIENPSDLLNKHP